MLPLSPSTIQRQLLTVCQQHTSLLAHRSTFAIYNLHPMNRKEKYHSAKCVYSPASRRHGATSRRAPNKPSAEGPRTKQVVARVRDEFTNASYLQVVLSLELWPAELLLALGIVAVPTDPPAHPRRRRKVSGSDAAGKCRVRYGRREIRGYVVVGGRGVRGRFLTQRG